MRCALLTLFASSLLLAAKEPVDLSGPLGELLAKTDIPGAAAVVMLKGEPVVTAIAGVRKLGSPEKVTLEDHFHLGSCTKSMTASLAAMLVADGKITWETKVSDSFPGLRIDPGFRDATLRQLLSNTGGAPHDVPAELWSQFNPDMAEAKQRKLLVSETLKSPPAYPPGQGSTYSNTGFSIAGAMLEKATGKPYDKLLTERLFKPLGMKSAGFGAPATPGKVDQPYGHRRANDKLVAVDPAPGGDNPAAITPAGRVNASILDFAKYASFHLGDVKGGPLNESQLRELHQNVPPAKGYGYGWGITERPWAGGTALSHTGSNTMFFCVVWLAPAKDFAVVVACNSGDGAKFCDDVASLMIQRCAPKE